MIGKCSYIDVIDSGTNIKVCVLLFLVIQTQAEGCKYLKM